MDVCRQARRDQPGLQGPCVLAAGDGPVPGSPVLPVPQGWWDPRVHPSLRFTWPAEQPEGALAPGSPGGPEKPKSSSENLIRAPPRRPWLDRGGRSSVVDLITNAGVWLGFWGQGAVGTHSRADGVGLFCLERDWQQQGMKHRLGARQSWVQVVTYIGHVAEQIAMLC